MAPPIIISPIVPFFIPLPGNYYNVPAEFPSPTYAALIRFINYPWDYQPPATRLVTRLSPP